MGLDYEHELGNGWNKYEIMVLTELKRLADQGAKTATILQAHEIHFAELAIHNRQRDEVLSYLVDEMKTLRTDHDRLATVNRRSRGRVKFGTRMAALAVGALSWCAMFGVAVYAAFFKGGTPPHHP